METTAATNKMDQSASSNIVDPMDSSLALRSSMNAGGLQKRLEQRPAPDELVNRNILKTPLQQGVSPALAAASLDLTRQLTADVLANRLRERSSVSELVDINVLKASTTNTAAALQCAQTELERCFLSDSLNSKLSNRTDANSLVEQNIMKDPTVAASLQEAQMSLLRERTKNEVERNLRVRRSVEDLVNAKIMVTTLDGQN